MSENEIVADAALETASTVSIEEVTKIREALAKANKEAGDRRMELKRLQEQYAGIDPEKARKAEEALAAKEEEQLIEARKFDEVLAKRNEKWQLEMNAKQQEMTTKQQELTDKIIAAESRANAFKDRVLDDSFRAAANEITDMHQSAVDEMLLGYLRTIFTLDDNGIAVQRNANGDVILGSDGKTPLSPKDHLESLRPTKPWLFKVSSSGSPATGKQAGAVAKDLSHLKPADRLTAAREIAALRK